MALKLQMGSWIWINCIVVLLPLLQQGACFLPLSSRSTSPRSRQRTSRAAIELNIQYNIVEDIERVYCLSDLHVDHSENREWVEERCQELGDGDLLVLAGDISHHFNRLEDTFQTIQATGCRVVFLPGNHEAWLSNNVDEEARSSYEKLKLVEELCRDCGVLVDPILLVHDEHPLWIVPLQSWYDGSLSIPQCEDLCVDFLGWPWTDFRACEWPNHPPSSSRTTTSSTTTTPSTTPTTFGKIPMGLADYFHTQNRDVIDMVKSSMARDTNDTSIMTMSHFLPHAKCLPDWKDLSSDTFLRDEWLKHGAPGTSAKFAKVAGSMGLEEQIREIQSDIHVFGHSHRPKDFWLDGIRYVHNPLGNPRERLMYMVSPHVSFQLLWDMENGGQVHNEQVLRLWEEEGGGIHELRKRLELHGRRRPAGRSRFIL